MPHHPTPTPSPSEPPRAQIRSRDRVRDLAEVFTHPREVNAMLDMIPDMFVASRPDAKFLEPACGNGNFLVEILRRKLNLIRYGEFPSPGAYEFRVLRAVASIYGVDISAENVAESRERMLDEVLAHYYTDAPADFVDAVKAILETNIVEADFLAESASTEVIDYQAQTDRSFIRVWSYLDGNPVLVGDPTGDDMDDPSDRPVKQDAVPVYYLDLLKVPQPTVEKRG